MPEVSNIRTGAAPAPVPAPTASQAIIAEAAKTVFVTSANGRSIEVRRPSNVTRRNARKAVSAESQTKPELFGEYLLAFLVASIDGAPVVTPSNEQQAEAIQDRLGDEGLFAVMMAAAKFGEEADAVATAKNS